MLYKYIYTHSDKSKRQMKYISIYIYVVIFFVAHIGGLSGGGNQRCYFSADVLRNEAKKRERERRKKI